MQSLGSPARSSILFLDWCPASRFWYGICNLIRTSEWQAPFDWVPFTLFRAPVSTRSTWHPSTATFPNLRPVPNVSDSCFSLRPFRASFQAFQRSCWAHSTKGGNESWNWTNETISPLPARDPFDSWTRSSSRLKSGCWSSFAFASTRSLSRSSVWESCSSYESTTAILTSQACSKGKIFCAQTRS